MTTATTATRALAIVAVLLVGVAHAEVRPWAEGVSEKDQKVALALFGDGNKLVERANCKDALDKFRRALDVWDHPAIRYNAALCLIKLDKPIEALENIKLALRFGDAPLGADEFALAQKHQAQLERDLAQIEISCTEAGAKVTVDGVPLVECPGQASRYLLAGSHQLLRSKPKYETETKTIVIDKGKKESVVLGKMKFSNKRVVRRWSWWVPYAVMTGGVVVGAATFPIVQSAQSDYDVLPTYINSHCLPEQMKCPDSDPMIVEGNRARDSADRKMKVSYGVAAAGGAIFATGFIMLLLNQRRVVETAPTVTPTVGPDGAGVSISGLW